MYQETSSQAYASILQTLQRREEAVYLQLKEMGEATNRELKEALGWEINELTGRTNSLVKKGLVREKYKRPCRVTGRTAITWEVINL